MKFAKVLSIAAAAATVSAIAVSASAELVVASNPNPALTTGTGMWMMKLYCPSESIDQGIDCLEIGSVVFTIKAAEPEWFEGMTGGAVILSSGPSVSADHNWNQKNFWGVEDGELVTVDAAGPLFTEAQGDFTYTITCPVDDTNCVMADAYATDDAYVQVALSEWGQDMSAIEVTAFDVYDKSGALMISFDGNGNVVSAAAPSAPAETPADNTDTPAPAGDKGSPDTGVEGVAAVAGIAAVAAGAVVLSKKRK